ncbi:MAG: hypothetical protein WBL95_02880 [Microcoleus sp.]
MCLTIRELGIGHWEWGIGHGEWGMGNGHWALGIGHWAWVIAILYKKYPENPATLVQG